MTPQEAFTLTLLFRIGERVALSVIIVVLSCVVMIAFWRSIQRVDFQVSREKLGAAGSIVFSTPVFLLLALVGYTYVSLANPIAVDFKNQSVTGMTSDREPPGSVGGVDNTDFERQRAINEVRSLNCLVTGGGATLSARVEDDIDAIKLRLLEPVWLDDWGAYGAFADYALHRSTKAPNAAALIIFEGRHRVCEDLSQ